MIAFEGRAVTPGQRKRERLRLMDKVFENSAEAILITDGEGSILEVNPAFSELTGYRRNEVLGKNPRLMRSGRHDPDFYRDMWERLRRTGHWRGEVWDRRKDGREFLKQLSISALRSDDDGVTHYVGIFLDITPLKEAEARLRHLAYHDPLTGLPNRALFFDRLRVALRAHVRRRCDVGVLFIDLDEFKTVNDHFDHRAGDDVLIEAARRLRTVVRKGDTVARLGGDEFTVLLCDLEEHATAESVAQRVVELLSQPFSLHAGEVRLSASVGIALGSVAGDEAERVVRAADAAMYCAKAHGKDQYSIFGGARPGARSLVPFQDTDRSVPSQEAARGAENTSDGPSPPPPPERARVRRVTDTGYVIGALLLCLVIVFAGWMLALTHRASWREHLATGLTLVLAQTLRDLDEEFDNWLSPPRRLAARLRVVGKVEHLLDVPRLPATLRRAPAQARLRALLAESCGYRPSSESGFFIIGPDDLTLGSQSDADLGRPSPLAARAGFLARIRAGEAAITYLHSARPAAGEPHAVAGSRIYAGVPIENAAGKVIAVLACVVRRGASLSQILGRHTLMLRGETYALDAAGRLLSRGRFAAELRKLGLARLDGRGGFYFVARDPGVDLTAAPVRPGPSKGLPLTRMAESATSGGSGVDVGGYRDPRGVPVIGAWAWDRKLGFAVATEVSEAVGYAPLRSLILTIITVSTIAVCALLGVTLAFLHGRRRIAVSEQRFHDLAVTGSDWLWETGADLRFTFIENHFFEVAGIEPETYLGKTPDELYAADVIRIDPEVWAEQWRLRREHRPFADFRSSIATPDGRTVYLSSSGRPYRDRRGRFAGFRGTSREITPEVEALTALCEHKERLEFLLAYIDEGVFLHDGQVVVDVSPVGAAMFGYRPCEVIGMPAIDLVAPEGRVPAQRAIAEDRHDLYELPALGKDGKVFPIEVLSFRATFQGRRLRVTVTRDISARKANEKKREVRVAIDAFLGEVAVLASECEQVESFAREVLERLCGFLGWPAAHACLRSTWNSASDPFTDVWFPAPPGASPGADSKGLGAGRREPVSAPLVARIRARGEPLWVPDMAIGPGSERSNVDGFPDRGAAFGFPIYSSGDVVGVIECFTSEVRCDRPPIFDHHAQLAAQIARAWERECARIRLQRSEQRFRAIAQVSSDWVWEMNSSLRYCYLSPGVKKTLGIEPERWLGHGPESLAPAQRREEAGFEDLMGKLREHRSFKNLRHFVSDAGGGLRCLFSHGSPVADMAGRFCGYQGASSDITPLYEAEVERERAKREAERSNRAKSEFLSSLSHDFRTPLNAIIGFSQLLDTDPEEPLSVKQKESIAHIMDAGRHLANLLGEVLELSRIEAGKVELIIERIRVCDLIGECIDLIEPAAKRRGVRVEFIQPDRDVGMVEADSTRLHSVLMNLLSNAVKYSPLAGVVTVRVEPMADQRSRLSVGDSGPGIPEAQWPKVFEPFDRLGAQRSSIGGTGIGLSISKKLMELMHGRIGFDSEPGTGSTFWIELPAVGAARPGDDRAQSGDVEDLSTSFVGDPSVRYVALYVEDDAVNRALMTSIVAGVANLELETVPDAETALEILPSNPPDLILMDINLPGMDGIHAIREIRAHKQLRRIPALAVSAVAMRKTIEAAIEAGFTAYLTKPLDVRETVRNISRALGESGRSPSSTGEVAAG